MKKALSVVGRGRFARIPDRAAPLLSVGRGRFARIPDRAAPLLALLAVLFLLGACQNEDVGFPCKIQTTGQGAQVNSQGLDCETRLCLLMGDAKEATPQCTKICGDDGDCPSASESICADGFQCISVLQTGALKCCKMCVCKRFIPAGGSSASSFCSNYTPNCPSL